ncbi:hypothetical protein [uncultured Marinobacter sp.]|nr:hypothetical protein [uncultured Marinobacter sp.]
MSRIISARYAQPWRERQQTVSFFLFTGMPYESERNNVSHTQA